MTSNKKIQIIFITIAIIILVVAIFSWRKGSQFPSPPPTPSTPQVSTDEELKVLQEQLKQLIELKDQLEKE